MSRLFWFTVGAGSGVYAMVKSRRAAERLTPAGIADQLGALGHGLRLFAGDVRAGMVEHETRLRAQLDPAQPGRSALPPASDATAEGVST